MVLGYTIESVFCILYEYIEADVKAYKVNITLRSITQPPSIYTIHMCELSLNLKCIQSISLETKLTTFPNALPTELQYNSFCGPFIHSLLIVG